MTHWWLLCEEFQMSWQACPFFWGLKPMQLLISSEARWHDMSEWLGNCVVNQPFHAWCLQQHTDIWKSFWPGGGPQRLVRSPKCPTSDPSLTMPWSLVRAWDCKAIEVAERPRNYNNKMDFDHLYILFTCHLSYVLNIISVHHDLSNVWKAACGIQSVKSHNLCNPSGLSGSLQIVCSESPHCSQTSHRCTCKSYRSASNLKFGRLDSCTELRHHKFRVAREIKIYTNPLIPWRADG